ncbi:hypothetical protein [Ignavibacterium sp.]|uniref:hypothetical protein n=1 Tax=Ignavibacterium sp. TaxID=2651167 RepID=UPI0021FE4BAB|nr:hypothetical protein [Ignavibacterium sp.]BDQ03033.1 MAG: hypothetical protein KatS3mg037_1608 [Ignavibacterium sp.]
MTKKEFLEFWIKKLTSDGIKIFPDDFLESTEVTSIKIPAKTLIPGSELFGTFEVITTDGEVVAQAENYSEAKYYVYASQLRKSEIKFPVQKNLIPIIVKRYELYIDSIINEISKDFKKKFSDIKETNSVSEILKTINLVRY